MLIAGIIYRRVIVQTFGVLVIVTATLVVTQLLDRAELLIGGGRFALVLLYFAAMITPSIIVVLAPVALLVGVARAFRMLNEDRELTIAQANGVSPGGLAAPIAIVTAALACIVLIFSLVIEPYASRTSQSILNATTVSALNNATRLRSSTRLDNNMILWIGEKLPDRQFGKIVVFDNSDQQVQRVIFAERGHLVESPSGNLMALRQGEIQSKHVNDDTASRVEFTSYALMLPMPGGATDQVRPRQESTMALLGRCGADCLEADRRTIWRELHRRFSDWIQVFACGAIAAYFFVGAATTVSNLRQNFALALVIAILVRGMGFVALSGGNPSSWRAGLAYGAPLVAAFLFGALALSNNKIPATRNMAVWLWRHVRKRPV